jgi:hypothetical protein
VTRLQKALIRLDSDLRALGVQWALVGGFAVMLRVESRSTRDLDIVLAVTDDRQTDTAVLGLRMRGYRDHPATRSRSASELFGRQSVRLRSARSADGPENGSSRASFCLSLGAAWRATAEAVVGLGARST